MELIVLERYPEIDYAIIYRKGATCNPFVAAWGLSPDMTWNQGHYFEHIYDCVEYVNQKQYEYWMNRKE